MDEKTSAYLAEAIRLGSQPWTPYTPPEPLVFRCCSNPRVTIMYQSHPIGTAFRMVCSACRKGYQNVVGDDLMNDHPRAEAVIRYLVADYNHIHGPQDTE